MAVNLRERAYELEQAIRNCGEFIQLKELHEAIQKDDIARKMFENFRDMQVFLQQKQMLGQEITDEEVQEAQKMIANVQRHEVIGKLMEAEERMSNLITELSQIIMKPLEELYGPVQPRN